MNKLLQSILLIIVLSMGIGARMSILGWLFLIGIGSILVFGIMHFFVHSYALDYFSQKGYKYKIQVMLSHLSFLGIFLFQSDTDDSRGYTVLSEVFGIESGFINESGFILSILSIIVFLAISLVIMNGSRNHTMRKNNYKYIIISGIASFIFPFIFINNLENHKSFLKDIDEESEGEYRHINRASKQSNDVKSIDLENKNLSRFPKQIFQMSNIQTIHLNQNRIHQIPKEISSLEELEILNLIDNDILEIPIEICDCPKLKELRIGGNIKAFPDCLKTMQSLRHLSVQSIHANELLDELRNFDNITTAHFYLKTEKVDFSSMTEAERNDYFKNMKAFDKEKWDSLQYETGIFHKR